MTRIIVSRDMLFNGLQSLPDKERYHVYANRIIGELTIDFDIKIYGECNTNSVHDISKESVERLKKVLLLIQEQPMTIAIDEDNLLYIKEVIL